MPSRPAALPAAASARPKAEAPIDRARRRRRERRLDRLIDRLPQRVRPSVRWLRRPQSRWARIPMGVLLMIGGLLSILPFLGLWMLPLGFLLLADDLPPFRRLRDRLLIWIERRRPHWLQATDPKRTST